MKPTLKKKEYLDYGECTKYIEEKYGILTRDYGGRYKGEKYTNSYLDFWHWLFDGSCINNGADFMLYRYGSEDYGPPMEDYPEWEPAPACEHKPNECECYVPWWVQEIIDLYFLEFGEYSKDDFLEFNVWW